MHDLLRRHEPEFASRLRVIAATPPTPIPPLVAATGVAAADAERIAGALMAAGASDALAAIRATLLLEGFAPASADAYRVLQANAQQADGLGYPRLS